MKNHWDTIAIIGVNLALGAVLMALCISNNARSDSANARIDASYIMFYELLKTVKH